MNDWLIGEEGRDSCRMSETGEIVQWREATSGLTAHPAERESWIGE
ncbi:hypothetical protein [Fictibacillus phosphorivorans]|nr:hypothetical protein [Fictibacillus phosphorivorans]MCM3717245.1 hypothetical protein [Fictibacillus phosphorivorans]MCM3774932.1 hypothetical protein [Fictibacillus phosphorivorans]